MRTFARAFLPGIAAAAAVLLPFHSRADVPPPGNPNEIVPEVLHGFTAGVEYFNEGVIAGGDGNFYGISEYGGQQGAGCIYRVTPAGVLTIMVSFGDKAGEARGINPLGKLAYDGVGKYYGATRVGGRFNAGTVFRMDSAGQIETLVDFSFRGESGAPAFPSMGLTRGADGNFYGATSGGGEEFFGTIYRVSPLGGFQMLASFGGDRGRLLGNGPSGQMALRSDGSLIGTTFVGGATGFGNGTIFRVNPDGTAETVGDFTGVGGPLPGISPDGNVGVTPDGNTVYGITQRNGDIPGGLWRMGLSGPPQRIASFGFGGSLPDIDAVAPGAAADAAGNAVVTMNFTNSAPFFGGVYRISPAGAAMLIADFSPLDNGLTNYYAARAAVSDGAGGFVGVRNRKIFRIDASNVLAPLADIDPDGATDTGLNPNSLLAFGADGTLYGRNYSGSTNATGAVFKMPPGGPLTLLRAEGDGSFNTFALSYQMALSPSGSVVVHSGGSFSDILSIDSSSGISTVLGSFPVSLPGVDLDSPSGGLVADGTGGYFGLARSFLSVEPFTQGVSLYRFNGSSIDEVAAIGASDMSDVWISRTPGGDLIVVDSERFSTDPVGRILRVTPGGAVTPLADFGAASNTSRTIRPEGPAFVEASGSALVFTSGFRGDDIVPGLVRMSPTGQLTRVGILPQTVFSDDHDEPTIYGVSEPLGPALPDAQNRVYGVARFDAGEDFLGGIFRVDPSGSSALLYSFRYEAGARAVGGRPDAGLTKGPDGAFYGTTTIGGPNGGGTVFRFFSDPAGESTTQQPTVIEARQATFAGEITDNGFAGEYWFEYGTDPLNLSSSTEHVFFGGFHGIEGVEQPVTGLKGHRTYHVRLKVRIGGVVYDGPVETFATPNGPPTAEEDTILAETSAGPFVGRVLENDIDLDDDPVAVESFTNPGFGTVTHNNGVFTYVPGAGFTGKDEFTYTINDGLGMQATATVKVLTTQQVAGDFAGLVFDEADFAATDTPQMARAPQGIAPEGGAPLEATAFKARGFISLLLSGRRTFTGKVEIDGVSYPVKDQLDLEKPTGFVPKKGGGLVGTFVPSDIGLFGKMKLGNRTIVFRAGRSFGAQGQQRAKTTFTTRLEPTVEANPLTSNGLPAGSGFALIRVTDKGKTKVAGVLPDGTPFAQGSIIDGEDNLPFLTRLYKKKGSFEGLLKVENEGDVDDAPGRRARWVKPGDAKEKRFPGGIDTALRAFGGKFTTPSGKLPPIALGPDSRFTTTFRRGGLFGEVRTVFESKGGKEKVVTGLDEALAKFGFKGKTGLFTGSIRTKETGKKPVKFKGVITQRDNAGAGFFLGDADAGSVMVEAGSGD